MATVRERMGELRRIYADAPTVGFDLLVNEIEDTLNRSLTEDEVRKLRYKYFEKVAEED